MVPETRERHDSASGWAVYVPSPSQVGEKAVNDAMLRHQQHGEDAARMVRASIPQEGAKRK